MKISTLCKEFTYTLIGPEDPTITHVTHHTDDVREGSLFCAVVGARHDGHDFIASAYEAGARTFVCQKEPAHIYDDATYIIVERVYDVMGYIASAWYGYPSHNLTMIGVTGTNGKTTVATLMYQLLMTAGYKTGLISTAGNKILNQDLPATHTTPDPFSLQKLLRDMVDTGCTHVCMEVSSHALDQGRINGISFTSAAFTNITHDHIDYHGSFENYLTAKRKLFMHLDPSAHAIINFDDENAEVIGRHSTGIVHYFGLHHPEQDEDRDISHYDAHGHILAHTFKGLVLSINGTEVTTQMMGAFNAYNILTVYTIARTLDIDHDEICAIIPRLEPPQGRFQAIADKGRLGIIDYAHTPDALENVLSTILEMKGDNARIITVIGCGGDRDKKKRGPMASIAITHSDRTIFTSDNPRSEDPHVIIDEMIDGIADLGAHPHSYMKVVDRREAIMRALQMSKVGDIVLIAGKGHETYQEIQGVRHPFSDKEVAQEILEHIEEFDE